MAKAFPDCEINGIELTHAGIGQANNTYSDLNNTKFWQADGYAVGKKYSGAYDVVLHVNVLEHVPEKEAYIAAGLKLLKPDGLLLVAFPTESYWRFWGFPKFLGCRIFKKEFLIHGFSYKTLAKYLKRENLEYFSFHNVFAPARRLYYYIPESLLLPFGKLMGKMESICIKLGFIDPLMFVFLAIPNKKNTTTSQIETGHKNSRWGVLGKILGLLICLPLLLLTFFFMIIEVFSGRKTFFKQD